MNSPARCHHRRFHLRRLRGLPIAPDGGRYRALHPAARCHLVHPRFRLLRHRCRPRLLPRLGLLLRLGLGATEDETAVLRVPEYYEYWVRPAVSGFLFLWR